MLNEATVFIVDDDPAFLDSLSLLILSMGLQVKTFGSYETFIEAFDQTQAGCIILDVRMPNMSGLAMQEKLKQYPLCPPIVILTGHAEVPVALRAFRQGALDFLQKTFEEFELRDVIQRAIALDTERRAAHGRREAMSSRLALLSQAERQVLNLVIEGHPNKKIASTLEVSRRAVEDRRARLMQKLRVDNLPELVKFAVSAGIAASV
ncbi:MAG: response regulator [Planctomycetia bacterium]|nr:response regulator [Planctomycetia bacterium]